MSKFVRIDNAEDPKKATMLNLYLVATVELVVDQTWSMDNVAPRASLTCYSADRMQLASLYFDNEDQAKEWVLQHLGVQL